MEVCPISLCDKCANFETPCVDPHEECADIDGTKTCRCKSSFVRDESGDCKKPSTAKIWAPIVSLVVFSLVVVFVVLFIRHLKRKKKSKELAEEKKRRKEKIQSLNYDQYEKESYETPYRDNIYRYNEYNPSSDEDFKSEIYDTYIST